MNQKLESYYKRYRSIRSSYCGDKTNWKEKSDQLLQLHDEISHLKFKDNTNAGFYRWIARRLLREIEIEEIRVYRIVLKKDILNRFEGIAGSAEVDKAVESIREAEFLLEIQLEKEKLIYEKFTEEEKTNLRGISIRDNIKKLEEILAHLYNASYKSLSSFSDDLRYE